MRLESAMYSSRSGLEVHGEALNVVGDNIANANTVAFRRSRAEFADIFSDFQKDAVESGNGVSTVVVRSLQEAGTIENTGRSLDVAINGQGYFVIGDKEAPMYSRAGNFSFDKDGLLVNAQGLPVLGYVPNGTELGPIDINAVELYGAATTQMGMFGNLNSSSPIVTVPAAPTTFEELNDAASFSQEVQVVDSLGKEHSLRMYFFKTAGNSWTVSSYIDGQDVGGAAGSPVAAGAPATLNFGPDGKIAAADSAAAQMNLQLNYAGGADVGNVVVDLSSFSQFAAFNGLTALTQDGVSASRIKGYAMGEEGQVYAVLEDETKAQVGTISLALFTNDDGLSRLGNTLFAATDAAGDVTLARPGQEGTGNLQGSSLERSTVDLGTEFIDLVLFQRGYQANSSAFSNIASLIKDTIGLMR